MYKVTPLPPLCPQLHNCLHVISNPDIIPPSPPKIPGFG